MRAATILSVQNRHTPQATEKLRLTIVSGIWIGALPDHVDTDGAPVFHETIGTSPRHTFV